MTREYILAMKELWTREEAEYHGKYVDFPTVTLNPKPLQKPHPPIILGGKAPNVHRRVVQWADGWMPDRTTPQEIKQGRLLIERLAEEWGRDPATIQICASAQPPHQELIKRYQEAGADRVMIRMSSQDRADALEELEGIAEKVLR